MVTGWNGEGTDAVRRSLRGGGGSGRLVLLCIALLSVVVGVIGHSLFVTIAAAIAAVLALISVLAAVRTRFAAHRIGRHP